MKMKSISLIAFTTLTILASFTFSDASTEKKLNEIAVNATLGNGSADVKTFNVKTVDFAAELKRDLAWVKKEFPKCGPFKVTDYRRDTIAAMLKFTDDQETAKALTELYNDKKLKASYSILTNNDIDCSRMWVQVFTNDGYLLELYYGLND